MFDRRRIVWTREVSDAIAATEEIIHGIGELTSHMKSDSLMIDTLLVCKDFSLSLQ
jgi:hypothetical protein